MTPTSVLDRVLPRWRATLASRYSPGDLDSFIERNRAALEGLVGQAMTRPRPSARVQTPHWFELYNPRGGVLRETLPGYRRAREQAAAIFAAPATSAVLKSLGRIAARGGEVVVRLGNHDIELALGEVQELFRRSMGPGPELASRVRFERGDESARNVFDVHDRADRRAVIAHNHELRWIARRPVLHDPADKAAAAREAAARLAAEADIGNKASKKDR